MTDYGPCGKCGKPMVLYSAMVYLVTWLGKPVCNSCQNELERPTPEGPVGRPIGGWARMKSESER